MREDILALCRAMGAGEEQDVLLLPLIEGASAELEHLLRRGVKPEDCGRSFALAAAMTAWTGRERERLTRPTAVVSVRKCQVGPAGFQDYLGERFDRDSGQWTELYGRKAELTLGLDLYAPEETEGAAMETALFRLARALVRGGPEGVSIREFSCGETEHDSKARLLRRSVRAVCVVCLTGEEEPAAAFSEFEVRGGLKE